MSVTHLSKLKAKINTVIDNACIVEDEKMMERPNWLKYVRQDGKFELFLKDKMITELAELMQRHECWCEQGKPKTFIPPLDNEKN